MFHFKDSKYIFIFLKKMERAESIKNNFESAQDIYLISVDKYNSPAWFIAVRKHHRKDICDGKTKSTQI